MIQNGGGYLIPSVIELHGSCNVHIQRFEGLE